MDPLTELLASPAAATILAAFVVVSLLGLFSAPQLIARNLYCPYDFWRRGTWWTPITSAFVHADLPHLLFNGFTFWAFAFPLERAIGSTRFAALYATGLVISAAGTWLHHHRDPGYRCLGASGAILAVLFAAIVYVPTASIYIFLIPLPIPAPLFAVLYVGFSLWAARRPGSGVAHDAHLWGALAGVLFVAVVDPGALARAWQVVFG